MLKAYDVVEKETFVTTRRRSYKTPLGVACLLTGGGEASLYRPGAAGNLSQHENNTLASPLSVAVSPATLSVGVNNGIGLEAMLGAGTLDHPLPRSIEARVTKRGKALVFLRRLGNYLHHHGGVAHIHHTKLLAFAGVDGKDRKALGRYKRVGIRANLFHETDGYVVGERSIEYSLTVEAKRLFRDERMDALLAMDAGGLRG